MMALLRILVFVSLIYLFYRVSKNFSKRSKLWTIKRLWTFIIIYIVAGLVSMFILLFSVNSSDEVLEQEELRDVIKEEEEVWGFLFENRIDEIDTKLIVDEWTYNLPTDEIVITPKNVEDGSISIYVSKREDPQSNEIYATLIQTPYTFNGIDVTDKIVERTIEFQNSELIFGEQEEIELIYNQLDPTLYMIEDFRGMDLDDNDIYNYVTGMEILYLNVPEHINIIDEDEIVLYPSNF